MENLVNLGLKKPKGTETVIVRKAMKVIPASTITVLTFSRYPPITEYYLKRKLQGTPIYHQDMCIATTPLMETLVG